MGEALRLVVGGPAVLYALGFGLSCLAAEVAVPYHTYAGYLKFLTLGLFVYVAAAFSIDVPWLQVAVSTLIPQTSLDRDTLLTIVAVFGTKISPYLFFCQASQEAEESQLSFRRGQVSCDVDLSSSAKARRRVHRPDQRRPTPQTRRAG